MSSTDSENKPAAVAPKFSVIIPTYNRRTYIGDALLSVLKQSLQPSEIIVVDDGSTDDTIDIVRTFGETIKYVYQPNAGVSAARNHGIAIACFEWIAFLDSDDTWEAEYLEHQARSIAQNPTAKAHFTNARIYREDGGVDEFFDLFNLTTIFQTNEPVFLERPLRYVIENHLYNFQLAVLHRQLFEICGTFRTDLRLGEDIECMSRIAQLTPFAVNPVKLACIIHRSGDKNNLSRAVTIDGIRTTNLYHAIFARIAALPNLNKAEKRSIACLHSSNRRQLGNLLLRQNKTYEARQAFKEGLLLNPSLVSLVKFIISYFPPLAKKMDRRGHNLNP